MCRNIRDKYVPKHERNMCQTLEINMCQNIKDKYVPKHER